MSADTFIEDFDRYADPERFDDEPEDDFDPYFPVTMELSEGKYLKRVCCLNCQQEVRGIYTFAFPIRLYRASVECEECSTVFCDWEAA